MAEIAAIIACLVLTVLAVFQVALIFGAPIGRYAWGGAHTVLPTNLRIGSAISVVLYAIFALIILGKAGFVVGLSSSVVTSGIWALVIYFVLGTALNSISRSRSERNVMTPVALLLAISCTIVAMN